MFKVSAPGTLMLMGEHAVLQGKRALVFAIDKRITVTLIPRKDDQIIIQSHLGRHQCTLAHISVQKPFQFALAAILQFQKKIPSGFQLSFESQFSEQLGFGSSAAVTVATVAVMARWLGEDCDIFEKSRSVVQNVQGIGSGADVAASLWGGLIAYQMESRVIKKFSQLPSFVAIYSGSKKPTQEVIMQVESGRTKYPELFQTVYMAIDQCVEQTIHFLEQENWQAIGDMMNIHQSMMAALGLTTPHLDQLIEMLRAQPTIYGAKISGSGLGDSIIGLGEIEQDLFSVSLEQRALGVQEFKIALSPIGLQYE